MSTPNEEIQELPATPKANVRKSIIRKGIQRTVSTAKYESIVIHDEIEEEIEWSTLPERDKKIKNWETILVSNFKTLFDRVLTELSLAPKKAYFKNAVEEKDYRPEVGSSHELDDLDPLES